MCQSCPPEGKRLNRFRKKKSRLHSNRGVFYLRLIGGFLVLGLFWLQKFGGTLRGKVSIYR